MILFNSLDTILAIYVLPAFVISKRLDSSFWQPTPKFNNLTDWLCCAACMTKIATHLGLPYIPCGFQIRFGGAKGVVTIDNRPELKVLFPGKCIFIRESMLKYNSQHTVVEALQCKAAPQELYLNQQVWRYETKATRLKIVSIWKRCIVRYQEHFVSLFCACLGKINILICILQFHPKIWRLFFKVNCVAM